MPSADVAKVDIESGVTPFLGQELQNAGNDMDYLSGHLYWSNDGAFGPVVRPDGVETGGAVNPAVAGGNDIVDLAALSVFQGGIRYEISAAAGLAITRGSTQDFIIASITIDNSQTAAVVMGTEGATFSETRGAAGGPPYIPVDSIEVAQVRLTSQVAAPIQQTEIYQIPGAHQERVDFPPMEIVYGQEIGNAGVHFVSPLPRSHTGDVTKKVFADYYVPLFAEVTGSRDFQSIETSHTVTSEQRYNQTVGAASKTLNNGAFNCLLNDGVTDLIVTAIDKTKWVRFYADRNRSPHIMNQGIIGLVRNFPADNNINADVSISGDVVIQRGS